MLVRSKRDHYHEVYRKEGAEFEHSGPLHEHIEPVAVSEAATSDAAPADSDPEAKCPCGSRKKFKNCHGKAEGSEE